MVFLFTMRGIQWLHVQNALRIAAHSVKNLFLIHCENIFIIFCVCFSGSSFFLCTALFFFPHIQIFYPHSLSFFLYILLIILLFFLLYIIVCTVIQTELQKTRVGVTIGVTK